MTVDMDGMETLEVNQSQHEYPLWEFGAHDLPPGIDMIARVLELDLEALTLRSAVVPAPFHVKRKEGGVVTERLLITPTSPLGAGGYSSVWLGTSHPASIAAGADVGGGAAACAAAATAAAPVDTASAAGGAGGEFAVAATVAAAAAGGVGSTGSTGSTGTDVVVVKTPHFRLHSDLIHEKEVLAALNSRSGCKSIPRLVGFVKDGDRGKYLVLTPVGTSVTVVDVVERRREFALHVARGVLDALEVAHGDGSSDQYVHCDIRPANIVLVPPMSGGGWVVRGSRWVRGTGSVDYRAVLVDWGLAAKVGTARAAVHGVRAFVHDDIIKTNYRVAVTHDLAAVVYLLVALRDPRCGLAWDTLGPDTAAIDKRQAWRDAAAVAGASDWNRAIAALLAKIERGAITTAAQLRTALAAMACRREDADSDLVRLTGIGVEE